MAEVTNGFMRTVIDHELVDPKELVKSKNDIIILYLIYFERESGSYS